MAFYYGFSTVPTANKKKFLLTDIDLVKQDLLNAFNTRRGSRVMQPNVGCIAWELIFENINVSQQNDLIANITSIVNNDPRVSLQSINLTTGAQSITVTLILLYLATSQEIDLIAEFNSQS